MNKLVTRISVVALLLLGTTYNYANSFINSEKITTFNLDHPTTTWDGNNWSNGLPTANSEVIIQGELILTESLHVKKMTIESTGSVLISSGINLIITNELINNSTPESFVVEHDANLIQLNEVVNVGAITVKRNSKEMVRNDMTFWSSPVSGQSIRQFSPQTLFNRFWTYDEVGNLLAQVLTSDTDQQLFESGLGYAIRVRNTLATGASTAHFGQFKGTPHNGTFQVPVQRENSGFNLVGNPYSSDIDIEKFFNSNPQVKSIFIWSHKFPLGHVDYNNNYEFITRGGSENITKDRIKVGEGFIVLIDENNVSPVVFTNEMRIVEISTKNRFFLQLNNEEGFKNQVSVGYIENATRGYDENFDQRIPNTLTSGIYTLVDNRKLIIDARDTSFTSDEVIKLGFKAQTAANYTISIAGVEGNFSANQSIYVKDYETESLHNLSLGNYTFTSNSGEFNERFEIVFTESDFLGMSDLNRINQLSVYKSNDKIIVNSTNINLETVEIIDVLGRTISTLENIKSKQIELNQNLKGIYFLKIRTTDGKIITKKITK